MLLLEQKNKEILEKYKNTDAKIQKLNKEKDFTDTSVALNLAIEKGSKNITIIGAIGTRIDHTIANIHILKETLNKNIKAKIINEKNEIELLNKETKIEKDNRYKYISIIPFTDTVTGLTITGMKYHLKNYTLQIGTSLGVSNEQIENYAKIQIRTGIIILIKSRD